MDAGWQHTASAELFCDGVVLVACVVYLRAATSVTTNLPFKEWGSLFHNAAAASAIADRLVHKGLLVRITGKSSRPSREDPDPDEAV